MNTMTKTYCSHCDAPILEGVIYDTLPYCIDCFRQRVLNMPLHKLLCMVEPLNDDDIYSILDSMEDEDITALFADDVFDSGYGV